MLQSVADPGGGGPAPPPPPLVKKKGKKGKGFFFCAKEKEKKVISPRAQSQVPGYSSDGSLMPKTPELLGAQPPGPHTN